MIAPLQIQSLCCRMVILGMILEPPREGVGKRKLEETEQ
jgi:hypothetical protein